MGKNLPTATRKAIYDFVFDALGITTIWAEQSTGGSKKQNLPDVPFATMKVISGPRQVGGASLHYKGEDTYTYRFLWDFTLSVNVYSNTDAASKIQALIECLSMETKRQTLKEASVGIIGSEVPTDLSEVLDTKYRGRMQVDIDFSYSSERDDKQGEIQSVEIEGILDDTYTVSITY